MAGMFCGAPELGVELGRAPCEVHCGDTGAGRQEIHLHHKPPQQGEPGLHWDERAMGGKGGLGLESGSRAPVREGDTAMPAVEG